MKMEVQVEAIEGNRMKEQTISSLPDFAQIFAFLQLFGNTLHLFPVTLKDLEDFFTNGKYLNTPRATTLGR